MIWEKRHASSILSPLCPMACHPAGGRAGLHCGRGMSGVKCEAHQDVKSRRRATSKEGARVNVNEHMPAFLGREGIAVVHMYPRDRPCSSLSRTRIRATRAPDPRSSLPRTPDRLESGPVMTCYPKRGWAVFSQEIPFLGVGSSLFGGGY